MGSTLAGLNLTQDSIMFIQAAFIDEEDQECNFDIQLIEDSSVSVPVAKVLKKGTPKVEKVIQKPAAA